MLKQEICRLKLEYFHNMTFKIQNCNILLHKFGSCSVLYFFVFVTCTSPVLAQPHTKTMNKSSFNNLLFCVACSNFVFYFSCFYFSVSCCIWQLSVLYFYIFYYSSVSCCIWQLSVLYFYVFIILLFHIEYSNFLSSISHVFILLLPHLPLSLNPS